VTVARGFVIISASGIAFAVVVGVLGYAVARLIPSCCFGASRMASDFIDGICPNCGLTRMELLTSGLWDGWSGPELLPASGVCHTGRCPRSKAVLETMLVGDEESGSAEWSPVDEDRLEAIEWVLAGRKGWLHHRLV
jgi:hypothetical protein